MALVSARARDSTPFLERVVRREWGVVDAWANGIVFLGVLGWGVCRSGDCAWVGVSKRWGCVHPFCRRAVTPFSLHIPVFPAVQNAGLRRRERAREETPQEKEQRIHEFIPR